MSSDGEWKFCTLKLMVLSVLAITSANPVGAIATENAVDAVNPFIGVDRTTTSDEGDTFPGATLPFGMLKAGPDMLGDNGGAGWKSGYEIDGFSQTHTSGTGGGSEYGNILVTPCTGSLHARGLSSPYRDERASPGFFHVSLPRYGIDVDIAAARRAAIYRFAYPRAEKSNLVIDAGHLLSDGAEWINPASPVGEDQHLEASEVTIESPTQISGSTTVSGGWNRQTRPYTVYFSAIVDTPASTWGTWTGGRLTPGSRAAREDTGAGTAAWLSFPTSEHQIVQMRIAISFISIQRARRTLTEEIPRFDFDATLRAARTAWEHALAPVEVAGASHTQRVQLYTALYHAMLMPTDRTGENPLWESSEPYYDDYYAIWDIFRTTSPLLTLIAPERQSAIVRSLVDIYRHEGWLPDARKGNFTGITQSGSNADVMLGDAFVRGLKNIDWTDAYAGMVKDAEMLTPDPLHFGRAGLLDYESRGFVAVEGSDLQGSRQMEYAMDDFAIAGVARALGHSAAAARYLRRSGNWRNLFDRRWESEGFRGFIRPRHRDGSWLKGFDALRSGSTGLNGFYEDSSWAYSFYVPQDVAGLIQAMGGRQTFVRRLDRFFEVPKRYYVGNEPAFLTPYLYIWAKRHDLTAERVRATLATYFNEGRSGLPGNDDSGAMSSWYTLGLLGLYPIAGTDIWLIGSPGVESTTLHLSDGTTFRIVAKGTSAENKYVMSATLNGKPLERAWLHHQEIAKGGTLELLMSPTPSRWPTGPLPPSSSDAPGREKP